RAVFRRLDAPQLIKHAIALTRAGGSFELLHLWYRPAGAATPAAEMDRELDVFGRAAEHDGVRFRPMTYQELFERTRASGGADPSTLRILGTGTSRMSSEGGKGGW